MKAKQFKKLGFDSLDDLENFLNREEVKHIIGSKKYAHFCELWICSYTSAVKGEPKKKIEGKFNWLALIASPLAWYAYRRMYALVFSLCAIFAALSFGDYLFGIDTSTPLMAAFLVLVLMSKDMYLGHLVRCVKKLDSMPNQERKDDFLKWRKGPSVAFAVFTTLFILAVTVYISILFANELLEQALYRI